METLRHSIRSAAWLALLLPAIARAEVGDPTLETDHPVYAGEGAFQEIEDCAAFATRNAQTPQQKAIAMYRWILQHQYHLHSPQEWNVGNFVPDAARPKEELLPYDANIARFSYGFGLCGAVHAWNEPYWRALGFTPRRRAFPGHTNSEIEYAGGWHCFDTDMAGLVFRGDGIVAGYEDIAQNPGLVKHSHPPVPCYPFAWPSDFQGMQQGWKQISQQGTDRWYRMYNAGYAAQPGVVHLRSGESFTRWFDRDHYGGLEKRRFWHADAKRKGGPFRDWTFVNTDRADHPADADRSAFKGNASYCNAEFIYQPDLTTDAFLEGVIEKTPNLRHGDSPNLKSGDGRPASVTFSHWSPYVIAGDPLDDLNPMSGPATGGLVLTGQAQGKVALEISADGGLSWQPANTVEGSFQVDLTDQVKGRYAWLIRFQMAGNSGLEKVQFATTCQMNQAMYPRLSEDGSQVTYRSASRGAFEVKPNFALDEQTLAKVEASELRSPNLRFVGHQKLSDYAYQTTNNKPAHAVFQVDSPQPLVQVRAAARYKVRVPPPSETDFKLELSTDGGSTWQPLGRADIPADNEYSSGWMAGQADISAANVTSALVKVQLYQGGYSTGLLNLRLYGLYRTKPPQAATVTYGWQEAGVSKTHQESIPAATEEHRFTVPTGKNIIDEFVRIEVP